MDYQLPVLAAGVGSVTADSGGAAYIWPSRGEFPVGCERRCHHADRA